MRIVAGRWRGRIIDAPRDSRVRPTADRVREAWLSIVAPHVPGARVLDLFAGSGALGLEALSRGAERVEFVELNPPSLRALGANVAKLGAEELVQIRRGDALRFLDTLDALAYDLAFADPPYTTDAAVRVAQRWLEVPFARVLGVEHSARVQLPEGGAMRRYGDTCVTIFHAADAAGDGASEDAFGADAPDGADASPDGVDRDA